MIRTRRILVTALALTIVVAPVAVLRVRAELDHAHELGKKIKCSCGGCEQSAGTCYHVGGAFSGPCDLAKTMIREIQGHLDNGLNDDQVITEMIKEYGPGAYVEPPKTGFGLVAWVMPGLYLFAGALLVVFVIGRWRKRGASSEAMAGAATNVSPEALERARMMARKATEE